MKAANAGTWEWGERAGFACDEVVLFISENGDVITSEFPPGIDRSTVFTLCHPGNSRCILVLQQGTRSWRFNADNGMIEKAGDLCDRDDAYRCFRCGRRIVACNDSTVVFAYEGGIYVFDVNGFLMWSRYQHFVYLTLVDRTQDHIG